MPKSGKIESVMKQPFFLLIFAVFAALSNPAHAQDEFPDGSLWRPAGDARVYVISNDRKRPILSEVVFNSYGWKMSNVKEADPDVLLGIPDIRVIKIVNSSAVFDITSGFRVPILSTEDFFELGYSWDEIAVVNAAELASYELPSGRVEVVPPPEPVEPLLLQKIAAARKLLHEAPPVYPQEKRVAKTGSFKSGSNSAEVKRIQEKLQSLGFFSKGTEANGNFGPATLAAVKAFQKSQNITPQNGVVGPLTLAALQKKGLTFLSAGLLVKEWRAEVPDDREVLLAVWHEKNDDSKLVKIILVLERIKVGRKFRTVYKVVTKTPGFTVHYKGGNGVNVQYKVTAPAGYKVLANRFPIFDQASGKIGTFPPEEEVYIPYRDEFLAPEIIAAGRKYMDEVVSEALNDLRSKGVRSVSGKGLVVDLTDPDELKNIAIIEHMDHSEFKRAKDKKLVVNKFFGILATNREDAYRFSGSSKGALGLAQFIKKTYLSINKKYPSAKLIPDFKGGMADHVNAFKAMALYHDVTGATMENYVREKLTGDPVALASTMAEVRAAAYNGGAGRVKMAIKKFGDKWQVAVSSRYGLRAETRTYLEKFKAVKQVLAAS